MQSRVYRLIQSKYNNYRILNLMSVGFRTTYCLFLICLVISELNVTLLGCYEPGGLILCILQKE